MTNPARTLNVRKHIQVQGVVQGVGFRPFVYKLAKSLGLTGYIFNSSSGVTIEVEGTESELNQFLKTLKADPPQLAKITDITVAERKPQGSTSFSILQSQPEVG